MRLGGRKVALECMCGGGDGERGWMAEGARGLSQEIKGVANGTRNHKAGVREVQEALTESGYQGLHLLLVLRSAVGSGRRGSCRRGSDWGMRLGI